MYKSGYRWTVVIKATSYCMMNKLYLLFNQIKKCDVNNNDDGSNDETDTSINIHSHGQVHNMLT